MLEFVRICNSRRLFVRFLFSLACVIAARGVAEAQPDPSWENMTNGGAVIYAGTYYAGQGPANAFDGAGTYYSGTSASVPHIGFDFVVPGSFATSKPEGRLALASPGESDIPMTASSLSIRRRS